VGVRSPSPTRRRSEGERGKNVEDAFATMDGTNLTLGRTPTKEN